MQIAVSTAQIASFFVVQCSAMMLDAYIIESRKPSLGQLVKAARKRAGLKQVQLEQMAGLKGVVRNLEQGVQEDVRYDTLRRLCEALGQPISYFFGDELAMPLPRPAKLVLLERIASLKDNEAERLAPAIEKALAALEGRDGELESEEEPNEPAQEKDNR